MGLEKSIKSGKEHRKEYHGAKAVDGMCRNHGGCPYCENGRLHKRKSMKDKIKDEMREINE